MFPLLVEEGREKSWPNVPQELLNENTCLGVAVVATHWGIATGVAVQSFRQYMAVVGGGCMDLGAANVSNGQCCSHWLCP